MGKNVNLNKIKTVYHFLFNTVLLLLILIVGVASFKPILFKEYSNREAFVVLSGSMAPTIKKDSLIIVQKVDIDQIKPNDIISFHQAINENDKIQIVTHRVAEIITTINGEAYKTEPEISDQLDPWIVESENIIGVVIKVFPYVGGFVLILQKYHIPILVFLNIILLSRVVKSLLYFSKKQTNSQN